ncbi:hypothetical protein C2869_15385 [Saccharobesus litoralis]|uniref:Orphan protein n=1 Tax=Saccharobesus litoralis TaxID=2172099 RepID=A0A2S0VU39_9ALTE|nr:hypothetical protein [Saccharobesus litoralis]AWB67736.1 hypothetical protein C2869_15385 [Saccharobesus litoralis]
MKEFVIIQDYLIEPQELANWHDNAELASDNLNLVLHMIFDQADQDISPDKLAELLVNASQLLAQNEYLTEFENEDEISDWVAQFLADRL